MRLKASTEIHKNSASQEWGSSGEALWSSGIWAEPVKFNVLCCSSSDKHWWKCLCGLGPGWATSWDVKMNKTRSYSSLHSFQNIFSLFFFLPFCKCVCGMHGIHPCVDAYMCCTWVSVQAYACTRVHRKWILAASTSGVFFHWAPFYVLKPGLLLNLKLAILGSLASLFSPRVYPALPPRLWDYRLLHGCWESKLQSSALWGKSCIHWAISLILCAFWCHIEIPGQVFLDPAITKAGTIRRSRS